MSAAGRGLAASGDERYRVAATAEGGIWLLRTPRPGPVAELAGTRSYVDTSRRFAGPAPAGADLAGRLRPPRHQAPVTGGDAEGTYPFIGAPQITISADHTDVTVADRTVTITGQATLVAPDGTTSPWSPSLPLVLNAPWLSNAHVTVQPGGSFTVVTSPHGASPAAFFVAGPDPRGGTVQSNTLNFSVQTDPAKVTASLQAQTITYGAKDTISGQVTYQPQPGAAYQGVAGEKVEVYSTQHPDTPAVTGATNASGGYSFPLPSTTGTTWTVKTGGAVGDTLLTYATATAPESVTACRLQWRQAHHQRTVAVLLQHLARLREAAHLHHLPAERHQHLVLDRQGEDELHRPLQRYGQRLGGLRDMGCLVRGRLNPLVGGTARNLCAGQVIALTRRPAAACA